MGYKQIPLISIKIIRGNTKRHTIQGIKVNGEYIDLTTVCPKVQFKTSVDAGRYVDFAMSVENGRMEVAPDRVTLKFGRDTQQYLSKLYYGDLYVKLGDIDAHILRYEIELTGIVTTKSDDEC